MRTRPAFIVSPEDKVDVLLKRLPTTTIAVVMEGKKYVGIVTDLTLRLARCAPDEKIKTVMWKAPLLSKKMTIEQMCEIFLHGYRELPIEEDGDIRIVKHIDILSQLLAEGRIPKLSASALSKQLEQIPHTSSIAQAASLMHKKRLSYLAAIDDGKIVGVVSSPDLTKLLEIVKERPPIGRERIGLDKIALKSIINAEMESIRSSATTIEAAQKMIEKDASALLIGNFVLTVADLLRVALSESEIPIEIAGLHKEDIGLKDDIRKECATTLAKIEKFFPIERFHLTVKKHEVEGRRAKWSMHAVIPRKKIAASASAWNPFIALHCVLREIERLAMKAKESVGAWRRTKKKRRLATMLRTGEEVGKPIK